MTFADAVARANWFAIHTRSYGLLELKKREAKAAVYDVLEVPAFAAEGRQNRDGHSFSWYGRKFAQLNDDGTLVLLDAD